MVLRTLALSLLLFSIAICRSQAQEPPDHFDPVVYLKMISMGDRYSDSRFLAAANTVASFENYMIDKADVIAFTLKQQDSAGTGWTVWLDFAMDRLGGKRLMKVFGQKATGEQSMDEYTSFLGWMEALLADKLGDTVKEEKGRLVRKYEGEPGYEITVRLTPPQDDGKKYITFSIDEVAPN